MLRRKQRRKKNDPCPYGVNTVLAVDQVTKLKHSSNQCALIMHDESVLFFGQKKIKNPT